MTEEIITFKKISGIWNDTISKNQNFFDNYFQSLTPDEFDKLLKRIFD